MVYIKRSTNEIIFKFSKNVELKIVNDPKTGQYMNIKNNCHGVKNMEFKFAN